MPASVGLVCSSQLASQVTFGGSYSGALSAWARQQYPEHFDAAVASSAPIQSHVIFEMGKMKRISFSDGFFCFGGKYRDWGYYADIMCVYIYIYLY